MEAQLYPFLQVILCFLQGQLYAFGQGLSGQLGIKTPHNRNLPQVVVGPWRSPGGVSLLNYKEEGEEEEEATRVYVRKVSRDSHLSALFVYLNIQPSGFYTFLSFHFPSHPRYLPEVT